MNETWGSLAIFARMESSFFSEGWFMHVNLNHTHSCDCVLSIEGTYTATSSAVNYKIAHCEVHGDCPHDVCMCPSPTTGTNTYTFADNCNELDVVNNGTKYDFHRDPHQVAPVVPAATNCSLLGSWGMHANESWGDFSTYVHMESNFFNEAVLLHINLNDSHSCFCVVNSDGMYSATATNISYKIGHCEVNGDCPHDTPGCACDTETTGTNAYSFADNCNEIEITGSDGKQYDFYRGPHAPAPEANCSLNGAWATYMEGEWGSLRLYAHVMGSMYTEGFIYHFNLSEGHSCYCILTVEGTANVTGSTLNYHVNHCEASGDCPQNQCGCMPDGSYSTSIEWDGDNCDEFTVKNPDGSNVTMHREHMLAAPTANCSLVGGWELWANESWGDLHVYSHVTASNFIEAVVYHINLNHSHSCDCVLSFDGTYTATSDMINAHITHCEVNGDCPQANCQCPNVTTDSSEYSFANNCDKLVINNSSGEWVLDRTYHAAAEAVRRRARHV